MKRCYDGGLPGLYGSEDYPEGWDQAGEGDELSQLSPGGGSQYDYAPPGMKAANAKKPGIGKLAVPMALGAMLGGLGGNKGVVAAPLLALFLQGMQNAQQRRPMDEKLPTGQAAPQNGGGGSGILGLFADLFRRK